MSNLNWTIVYTKQGLKDKKRACESGFDNKINNIIGMLKENPYTDYPPYEKIIGLCIKYIMKKERLRLLVCGCIMNRMICGCVKSIKTKAKLNWPWFLL